MWGAFTAAKGLDAWKEQNTWRNDYDLAIALYGTFRERRAIYHHIRSFHGIAPALKNMKIYEQIEEANRAGKPTQAKILFWFASEGIRSEQSRLFDEAKLRWGIDFAALSEEISSLEHELMYALHDLREAETAPHRLDPETKEKVKQVVERMLDKDRRKETYDQCFDIIESKLRPMIV